MAYALGSVAWGLVIAPFNSFDHHHSWSVALGAGLLLATAAAFYFRQPIFQSVPPQWTSRKAISAVRTKHTQAGVESLRARRASF
jgi:hypothetical protein